MSELSGAKILVECLKTEGISTIFGLAGGNVLEVLDVLHDTSEIRYIPVRHEQAAGFMASGWARISGKPGVSLVILGPGMVNIASGIANAFIDCYPLIALVGGVDTSAVGEPVHGDADWIDMVKPVTKYTTRVHRVDKLADTLRRGFREAMSPDPGPVCIEIPSNTLASKTSFTPSPSAVYRVKDTSTGDKDQILEAAKILLGAERPVILAGLEVLLTRGDKELLSLAEFLGIPVATCIMSRGSIPEDHPLSLGITSSEISRKLVAEADVLLSVGYRFESRLGNIPLSQIPRDAKIIHIDMDASRIGKNVPTQLGIMRSPKHVLEDLLKICRVKVRRSMEPRAQIAELKEEWMNRTLYGEALDEKPIKALRLMRDIRKTLKRDAIITVDNGNNTMWVGHYLPLYEPWTLLPPVGFGTMGFGFPAALGAKLAAPERQVVCVAGDGGFMMLIHELETAIRCHIPVVVVVMNDYALGMVKARQRTRYDGRYFGTEFEDQDFAKIAEAFGAYGERVEEPREIVPALGRALREDRIAVLDVIMDRDQIPPTP